MGRGTPTDLDRLHTLVTAGHPCIFILTTEERYALELVWETANRIDERVLLWSATEGVGKDADTIHPAAAMYYFANKLKSSAVCVARDLLGHLEDARTLRALRDVIRAFRDSPNCLILIDHKDKLPAIIAAEATRFELSLPDEEELEKIVRSRLKQMHRQEEVEVELKRSDFRTILRNLSGLTRSQAEQIITDCVAEDRRFDVDDINTVLAHKRSRLDEDGVLQFVETPNDLSQIGGLRSLKAWLDHRRNALSDEARDFGLPAPRGILLLGVQGAGKSLCAKATAAAWQRPLLRLDPGTLYDRYVGESERRLRSALHQAEMMAPIILWIDEIEKGFASAASQSTDGGLSQRMFGTLLTWMQEHQAPVFLLATANNIEALPPELLRKGRFDEIFFVDLPPPEVRRRIFEIHITKRDRDPGGFDLDTLAAASDGYSGAEIEQAVISALHTAFADSATLDTPRLLDALESSPPISVTMAESIARLRAWARDRCVPAD